MANLLIVEDDGLLRDALGAQLAQAGHTVTPAADGALAQGLPVLVLTARDPQALRERLTKVLAGAQRSAHLVQQLLSLARNEAEVRLQSLDLAALARDVARDWTPRALAAGVDLGYEGADALSIQGEPLLLREALNNLLDNALNYAGAGAVVTLRVTRQAGAATRAVHPPGVTVDSLWPIAAMPGACLPPRPQGFLGRSMAKSRCCFFNFRTKLLNTCKK